MYSLGHQLAENNYMSLIEFQNIEYEDLQKYLLSNSKETLAKKRGLKALANRDNDVDDEFDSYFNNN